MNIRYTKLNSGYDWLAKAKANVPVTFIKQQMFLVFLVVSSSILFILTQLFTTDVDFENYQDLPGNLRYGVIVDCGSSGSRAHIFSWRDDIGYQSVEFLRDKLSGVPYSKDLSPGLSEFRQDPDKASEYMEPIMNYISDIVPRDKQSDTPVYFMATAGLRMLDEKTQNRILSDIRSDISFKFNFPNIKTQVISGSMEGIYSWLSINMDRITSNDSAVSTRNHSKSFGMIELGGASAQVTFEVTPEENSRILKSIGDAQAKTAFEHEHLNLNFGLNEPIKLFTTTFLGLGVNSAREAAVDLLISEYINGTGDIGVKSLKDMETSLKDPCLTTGSDETAVRPVILLSNPREYIGYALKHQEDTFKVKLVGSGDFLNCLALLNRVLVVLKDKKPYCLSGKPCPMSLLGTSFIPYESNHFIGLSEMYFTTNEMMKSSGSFDRIKILKETKRICSTDYNKLYKTYWPDGVTKKDRIRLECFKASWLLTLTHDLGLRMPDNYDGLKTLEILNGRKIDWTFGAMMKEVATGLHT